ncbi:MAG: DUF427 domain-containing protein [Rhizobiaceae bacterium]
MEATIHRPDKPQHQMVLRPINKLVLMRLPGGQVLTESQNAIRLIEIGKTIYDPVIYLPRGDIMAELIRETKTTECPLKGTASYFGIEDCGKSHESIAWSYLDPFDFAKKIKGLMAFYPDRVIVEEHPV